jgi:hypothetical protein
MSCIRVKLWIIIQCDFQLVYFVTHILATQIIFGSHSVHFSHTSFKHSFVTGIEAYIVYGVIVLSFHNL